MPAVKDFFTELTPTLLSVLWKIVLVIVVFFLGRKLINALLRKMTELDKYSHLDIGFRKFIRSLLKVVLWALIIYFIADLIGLPTATFVALLGSAGVAIGLALQGSLSNFAGGVLLLFLHPFRVGDYVKLNEEIQGTVNDIGLCYTSMTTPDNRVITVPNGSLSNSNIINFSGCETRRIDITVGVAYDADINLAIRALTEMVNSSEKVIRKEDTVVFVSALAASSVNLGVRCWVKQEDYWNELWELNRRTKETLDRNGIEIPFNQMDIHLKEVPKNEK